MPLWCLLLCWDVNRGALPFSLRVVTLFFPISMILERNPLTLGCQWRAVAFVTVGLSCSAFVQRLCVSDLGSRQSTSLRPQGAKAPKEPLL